VRRHRALRLRSGLHILAEKGKSELTVVDSATHIDVVAGEELVKLLLGVVHAGLLEDPAELLEIYVALVTRVKILKHFDEASLFRHLVV